MHVISFQLVLTLSKSGTLLNSRTFCLFHEIRVRIHDVLFLRVVLLKVTDFIVEWENSSQSVAPFIEVLR